MVIFQSRKKNFFFLSSQKQQANLADEMDAEQRKKALDALKKTDSITLELLSICLLDLPGEKLSSRPGDREDDQAETKPEILGRYAQPTNQDQATRSDEG